MTDANSKFSVASNALSVATGGAVNDGLWYPLITHQDGLVLLATIVPTEGRMQNGWDGQQSGVVAEGIEFNTSSVISAIIQSTAVSVGTYTPGTQYRIAVVKRKSGNGVYVFIRGGAFSNWTLLSISSSVSGSFPAIGLIRNTTAVFTADNIRIPTATWLPVPLVSDGFSAATTDGLGHAEQNGGSGRESAA